MDDLEQVIASIRGRNVELIIDGEKIIASRPLLPDEKKALKEQRAKAIEIISGAAPETTEQAYRRGYADGVRHTMEDTMRSHVEMKQTNPDEEIARLVAFNDAHGAYWKWEPECLEALRAALVPGDRVQPVFAYTCIIVHANGGETEFKRVPNKKGK